MERERPAAVTVIASLCILAGVLGSCCNVIGIGEPVVDLAAYYGFGGPADPTWEKPELTVGETWQNVLTWVHNLLEFPISLLLVIAGLALLKMRPWARKLAIILAAVLLLSVLLWIGETCLLMTTLEEEEAPAGFPDELFSGMMLYVVLSSMLWLAMWLAFCVAVLVVLNRSAIRAAFAPPQRGDLA